MAVTRLSWHCHAMRVLSNAIAFDWADVAASASYTIQIDASDSFTNPLTFTPTLGTSQVSVGTLPTIRMWWRVRANTGFGAPGSRSQVRRFEVKQ